MLQGFCFSFNDERGYGFVCTKDDNTRIFAHRTDIRCAGRRMLVKDEPVEFDVITDKSGRWKAINIRRTSADAR